jgi:hypothetical protein
MTNGKPVHTPQDPAARLRRSTAAAARTPPERWAWAARCAPPSTLAADPPPGTIRSTSAGETFSAGARRRRRRRAPRRPAPTRALPGTGRPVRPRRGAQAAAAPATRTGPRWSPTRTPGTPQARPARSGSGPRPRRRPGPPPGLPPQPTPARAGARGDASGAARHESRPGGRVSRWSPHGAGGRPIRPAYPGLDRVPPVMSPSPGADPRHHRLGGQDRQRSRGRVPPGAGDALALPRSGSGPVSEVDRCPPLRTRRQEGCPIELRQVGLGRIEIVCNGSLRRRPWASGCRRRPARAAVGRARRRGPASGSHLVLPAPSRPCHCPGPSVPRPGRRRRRPAAPGGAPGSGRLHAPSAGTPLGQPGRSRRFRDRTPTSAPGPTRPATPPTSAPRRHPRQDARCRGTSRRYR